MFCIKCGSELEDGASFCTQCGSKALIDPDGSKQAAIDSLDVPATVPAGGKAPAAAPAAAPAPSAAPSPGQGPDATVPLDPSGAQAAQGAPCAQPTAYSPEATAKLPQTAQQAQASSASVPAPDAAADPSQKRRNILVGGIAAGAAAIAIICVALFATGVIGGKADDGQTYYYDSAEFIDVAEDTVIQPCDEEGQPLTNYTAKFIPYDTGDGSYTVRMLDVDGTGGFSLGQIPGLDDGYYYIEIIDPANPDNVQRIGPIRMGTPINIKKGQKIRVVYPGKGDDGSGKKPDPDPSPSPTPAPAPDPGKSDDSELKGQEGGDSGNPLLATLNSLIEEYGDPKIVNADSSKKTGVAVWDHVEGLCYARLLDFEQDGTPELVVLEKKKGDAEPEYRYEVFRLDGSAAKSIYENDLPLGQQVGCYSFTLTEKDGKPYIVETSSGVTDPRKYMTVKDGKFVEEISIIPDGKGGATVGGKKMGESEWRAEQEKWDAKLEHVTINGPSSDKAELQRTIDTVAATLEELEEGGSGAAEDKLYTQKVQEYLGKYGDATTASKHENGVVMVKLLDFDGNGTDELLIVYATKPQSSLPLAVSELSMPSPYSIEVWSADGGTLKQVFAKSISQGGEAGAAFGIYPANGSYQLYFNEGIVDQYLVFYALQNGEFAVSDKAYYKDSTGEGKHGSQPISSGELGDLSVKFGNAATYYGFNPNGPHSQEVASSTAEAKSRLGF